VAAHALRGLHGTGWPRASAAIAAELFEVAERIVPLEREVISDSAPDCPIWARWDERRRIRELLAAEANAAWLHSEPSATMSASTGEA
jgi:hypothetical protein